MLRAFFKFFFTGRDFKILQVFELIKPVGQSGRSFKESTFMNKKMCLAEVGIL